MRIGAWTSIVLVLFAGGEALAQPVCDAGGPYFASTAVPIQFDGTGSHSPGGNIISYIWDFGDGNTGTGPTPEHTYFAYANKFTVSLTVLADDKTSSTCQATVVMNYEPGPPNCDPGGPYYGLINEPIEFDGSRSSDPDGFLIAYDWDFGDGSTGTGTKPAHAYSVVGTYTVSLMITDNDGASSVCTTTASIHHGEGTPVCDAGGPYNAAINQLVQFDGTGSYDPEGTPIFYYGWDFGDGSTAASGATPQHSYADAAFYTVTHRSRCGWT